MVFPSLTIYDSLASHLAEDVPPFTTLGQILACFIWSFPFGLVLLQLIRHNLPSPHLIHICIALLLCFQIFIDCLHSLRTSRLQFITYYLFLLLNTFDLYCTPAVSLSPFSLDIDLSFHSPPFHNGRIH